MSDKPYDPLYHKKKALDTLSSKGKPLVIYRPLIKELGYNAAIVLSNLIYWSKPKKGKQSQGKMRDPDGWIYKNYDEWKTETFLNRKQVKPAVDKLKELGIIEKDRTKISGATPYLYRITAFGWEWITKTTEEYESLELEESATSENEEEDESATSNRQNLPHGTGEECHMELEESATSYITENTSGVTTGSTRDGEGGNVQICTQDPSPSRRLSSQFQTQGALDPYFYALLRICKKHPEVFVSSSLKKHLEDAKAIRKMLLNSNHPPTLLDAFGGWFERKNADWEEWDGKPNISQVLYHWDEFIEHDPDVIQEAKSELPSNPYDLAFMLVCELASPVINENNRGVVDHRRALLEAIGAAPEDIYYVGYMRRRSTPGQHPKTEEVVEEIAKFYVPDEFKRIQQEDPDYFRAVVLMRGCDIDKASLEDQLGVILNFKNNKNSGVTAQAIREYAEKNQNSPHASSGNCKGKKRDGSSCRAYAHGGYCHDHCDQDPEYQKAIRLYFGLSDSYPISEYAHYAKSMRMTTQSLQSELANGYTWQRRQEERGISAPDSVSADAAGNEDQEQGDTFTDEGQYWCYEDANDGLCLCRKRDSGEYCREPRAEEKFFCEFHLTHIDHMDKEALPCLGVRDDGTPCQSLTSEKNGYCWTCQFQSSEPNNKRCAGTVASGNRKGERCAVIMKLAHPGNYCGTHKEQDPDQVYIKHQFRKFEQGASEQCRGLTRKGTRCQHEVPAGNGGYCANHQGQIGKDDYTIAVAHYLNINLSRTCNLSETEDAALKIALEIFKSKGWELGDLLRELQAGFVRIEDQSVSASFRGLVVCYYGFQPHEGDAIRTKIAEAMRSETTKASYLNAIAEGRTHSQRGGMKHHYQPSQQWPS